MKGKHRLSASVDADLIQAAEAATRRGEAPNVSAWVNDALKLKREHDRRLAALAALIEAYEDVHGEITHDEMERAARAARGRAIPLRGTAPRAARRGKKKA